jgi:hypothetical protein
MLDPVVVLVEGESDALVVRRLARQRGSAPEVVAMGGVTNVRRYAAAVLAERPRAVLLGLADAGERRYLEKLEPPLAGVFVCERDLEEELLRARPAEVVLEVVDAAGLLASFRIFQGQPGWRDRDLVAQVRRFAGAGSGRKALLAEGLAARLDPATTPAPLVALLDAVSRWSGRP